jgi:hypothetical protein
LRDGPAAPTNGRQELACWQSALGASGIDLGFRKNVFGQLFVELLVGDLLLQSRKGKADHVACGYGQSFELRFGGRTP